MCLAGRCGVLRFLSTEMVSVVEDGLGGRGLACNTIDSSVSAIRSSKEREGDTSSDCDDSRSFRETRRSRSSALPSFASAPLVSEFPVVKKEMHWVTSTWESSIRCVVPSKIND